MSFWKYLILHRAVLFKCYESTSCSYMHHLFPQNKMKDVILHSRYKLNNKLILLIELSTVFLFLCFLSNNIRFCLTVDLCQMVLTSCSIMAIAYTCIYRKTLYSICDNEHWVWRRSLSRTLFTIDHVIYLQQTTFFFNCFTNQYL